MLARVSSHFIFNVCNIFLFHSYSDSSGEEISNFSDDEELILNNEATNSKVNEISTGSRYNCLKLSFFLQ